MTPRWHWTSQSTTRSPATQDRVLAVDVAPEVLDDETLPIWLPMTFGLDPADDREPDKLVADVFDPELELD